MTERQARWIALVGLLIWTAAHVFWVFRVEVNWDEFALLARAHESILEGRIVAGGRPGLSTLLLIPIVQDCTNTLATARIARILWTPFSVAILVGLWMLFGRLFAGREHRYRDALIGVGVLALIPPFLKYSVQVRTDQPAIALGLLGGAALLASRERVGRAWIAGVLFGLGYASSQKLIYVAALVALLAAAELVERRTFRWKRELLRAGSVVLSGVATLFVLRALVWAFAEPSPSLDVSAQLNVFEFYRRTIGYSNYASLVPGLLVPLGVSVFVFFVAAASLMGRGANRATPLTVIGVFLLGLAVAGFHAGAFPYFWLTLGLFPAVAVACGLPLLRWLFGPRVRRGGLVFIGAVILTTAVVDGVYLSSDGQALQRHTEAFVAANFPASARGFHTTRGLFCRNDSGLPTYFSQSIHFRFYTEGGEERVQEFLEDFRDRELAFIVRTFRLEQFPESIRRFWGSHYVPYWGPLLVPGVALPRASGERIEFEVLVPGHYVLYASSSDGAVIDVDGRTIAVGEQVELAKGTYTIRSVETPTGSIFALALPTPPGETVDRYYKGF